MCGIGRDTLGAGTMENRLTVWDLFAGSGGFSLGLHRTGGFQTTLFCEIDSYAQKVIAKNYPNIPIVNDVTKINRETVEKYGRPDVVTAGFPCQPYSVAGLRRGVKDERFLWRELFSVLQYTCPAFCIFENVAALLTNDGGFTFAGILYDLEQIGYTSEWRVFTASEFGYPHLRERVYIVAYPQQERRKWRILPSIENTEGVLALRSHATTASESAFAVARDALFNPPFFRSNDGVSKRLYSNHKHRNGLMGNAIIPDIAQAIGQSILDTLSRKA